MEGNGVNSLSEQSPDEQNPPPDRTQNRVSKEASRLAQLLKTEIRRNKPDFRITPAQERKWEQTADRMIQLDHRNYERIADLIRWAQRDEFWMSNILSMDKLREKFDALELKMELTTGGHRAQAPMADVIKDNPATRALAEMESV
jgi:hypothetical protein